MDTEVKGKWLDALRSGEYTQAKGVLTRVDENGKVQGHCCLGVLCEIAVKEGVIPAGVAGNVYDEVPTDSDYRSPANYDRRMVYGDTDEDYGQAGPTMRHRHRSHTELPEAVQKWAGLDETVPVVQMPRSDEDIEFDLLDGIDNPDETHPVGVASLNDDGSSFDAIADLIERDL